MNSGSTFLAKAVAPNEVIHVNARDVNSIFKIQASSATKPIVEASINVF